MAPKKLIGILFMAFSLAAFSQQSKRVDYYMIRIYHCATMDQVQSVEAFAGNTLKPFFTSNGIEHIGIFVPINNDTLTDKKVFVWIPFTSLEKMTAIDQKFSSLDPWGSDPSLQLNGNAGQPPYLRMEVSLSVAFRDMRKYDPATSFKRSPDNIYEYRSYESATESLHLNKVHMFNEGGEIPLFKRLDFNALFYARVIAGARMPNLVYITRFSNLDARNAHWKTFVDDPAWKALTAMEKYKGSVSRNETILMKASPLSDL
ncbi:MAG: NIPSNAP family protein [Chitinophagaceae bacterium]